MSLACYKFNYYTQFFLFAVEGIDFEPPSDFTIEFGPLLTFIRCTLDRLMIKEDDILEGRHEFSVKILSVVPLSCGTNSVESDEEEEIYTIVDNEGESTSATTQ